MNIKTTFCFVAIYTIIALSSCTKDKNTPQPTPQNPPPPPNSEEVITTLQLLFTDSATNITSVYAFEDADGDGGNSGGFLGTNQSDSVFTLGANKTYSLQIVLLDKTKNPVDTISHEVEEEGKDHMFFFNSTNPSGTPFTLTLVGSNIQITYKDLDAGTPQRGIGLMTRVRTYAPTGTSKHPFTVALRHQPDEKNGTFAPGDTDIEIPFKVKVN